MVQRTQTTEVTDLETFLRERGPFRERDIIAANLRIALEVSQGNKTHAAKLLGMTRWTILRRIGWLIEGAKRG